MSNLNLKPFIFSAQQPIWNISQKALLSFTNSYSNRNHSGKIFVKNGGLSRGSPISGRLNQKQKDFAIVLERGYIMRINYAHWRHACKPIFLIRMPQKNLLT
jgi:hypothetical protein